MKVEQGSGPRCFRCHRLPAEIPEYVSAAAEDPEHFEDAADYVRREEGTFNRATNTFACTSCYIAVGQPSSPRGWKAPPLSQRAEVVPESFGFEAGLARGDL